MKIEKKIIFVNPPSETKIIREGRCEQRADSYQYLMVPISLPSSAAVLREADFDVKIIDCIADEINLKELEEILKKESPFFVIINVATMSFAKDKLAAEICNKLKIPCAAMGMHVTTLPEESLKESKFDFVIRGEPEMTALNLAKAIGKDNLLKQVRGISYTENREFSVSQTSKGKQEVRDRKKEKIIHNKDAELIQNLDELPFPARDLLKNEKYIEPLTQDPYTLVITGRGCPYGCIFCTADKYYGKKQRIRSPKNIVDEIEEIIRKYGITHIGMWNDTFTFNKEQVIGISKEILKRNIKIIWFCNSRVDTFDEERAKWMSQSGCKVITFGVESLDEEILKRAKKNITLEQVKNAVEICKRYNIGSQLHLIFGLPGETEKTIENTIKNVIKLDPDYAQFYCAVPFPGTEFREYVLKNNFLKEVPWSQYEINNSLISYPNLSSKKIQYARKKAYRKFYLRPKYILKKMKKFPMKEWRKISVQAYNFFKGWVF
ncbi:MAG: radical SAM protein [Candidatus Pacearchaeota archaeon]